MDTYRSISIHVLREEDDGKITTDVQKVTEFLSTSSARRTTGDDLHPCNAGKISIHVLREEDDIMKVPGEVTQSYFYPRPPRGGRQIPTTL